MTEREKPPNPWSGPTGWLSWMTIVSGQDLGKLFMVTAALFFLAGGVMALLMRTQLAVPENHFLGPEVYNRLFTMHGSTMMYLVVVPFMEGLAMFVLPLLIGNRELPFPYVAAFSYWTYLFGGVAFYASMLTGTVADVGWFAYTPLSESRFSGQGTDFWSLVLTLVSIGDIAAGVGLSIGVIKLRAPGMGINRMPLFAWAWVVTGAMIAFAFTTLLVITTFMLPLDRTIGTHFFDSQHGGSNLLWQHLFWFFGHPEVYIMFIPATGIVSAVIPVFARRPLAAYTLVAVAVVVTGFVSFGLWVHHMFATGLPWLSMSFFTGASLMIAIASGVQVFAWIGTLWGRRPEVRVPLLFMLGFLFLFVLGGITGVMVAIVPFDWQVHDTYFLVAHFHYVLIGGVVFPALGGMYYWLPKMTGRMLNDRLGVASFWLSFIGFNVTFFPMHLAGLSGMPRRVYTYPATLGVGGYNLTETIGAYILGVGFLLFGLNYLLSLRYGEKAAPDPWGGDTLEWLVSSPAPPDNFRVPPIVHSRHPAWSPKSPERGEPAVERIRAVLEELPKGWRVGLTTSVLNAAPQSLVPWPKPSFIPIAASLGLLLVLLGTLAKSNPMMAVGGVISIASFGLWYKPNDRLLEAMRDSDLEEKTGLPIGISGPRSLDWWGLAGFLLMYGMVYAIFFYSYFYIRLYSTMWPQDHLPRPEWQWPAVIYGLLLASSVPQFLAARAFQAERVWAARFGMAAAGLLGLAFVVWQLHSLGGLPFKWTKDAYGSLFYVMSWLQAFTVGMGLVMNAAAQLRLWREGTNKAGYARLQMDKAAAFWYFTVAAGVLIYLTLYVSPYV